MPLFKSSTIPSEKENWMFFKFVWVALIFKHSLEYRAGNFVASELISISVNWCAGTKF